MASEEEPEETHLERPVNPRGGRPSPPWDSKKDMARRQGASHSAATNTLKLETRVG